MKKTLVRFALCALTIGLFGCKSTPPEYILSVNGDGVVMDEGAAFVSRFLVMSKKTAKVKTPSGNMKAQTEFRNIWERDIEVQYRYNWYSRDGVLLNPDAPMQTKVFRPGVPTALDGVSQSPKADAVSLTVVMPVAK